MSTIGPLAAALPQAIRPRFVHNNNGLRVHLLEAGFEESGRPCVVLLHGFPELAYSWRKIMMPLASAGFHVIAPDQRGYGRTTGWDPDYDGDLASFRIQNLVRDVLGLALALGYRSVHAVVGHDFGSPVAAYCALIRPDVFRSVVLMSAPFAGPPALPFDTASPEFFSVDIGQRHSRGSRRLGSAPQTLSMVLRDSGGERRHAERSGRSARFPTSLLPSEERR